MPYLRIFWLEFENNNVIFEISTLEFVWFQNFVEKKMPKIWDQECLIWVFLGYSHGHNILRIFDVLPIFPFTKSVTKPDY